MSKHTERWTADPITDAQGNITIRPYDGSPEGDIDAQPIATVYDTASALIIETAPELLEACELVAACLLPAEVATPTPSEELLRLSKRVRAAIAKAKGKGQNLEGD